MKPSIDRRSRLFFSAESLSFQLLSRSLIILALLLVLIGSLQYFFMRDLVYRNRATSLQSQVLSIGPSAWEQLISQTGIATDQKPIIFIPGATLAYIDMEGNYYVLETGPGDTEPPVLSSDEYIQALKQDTQGANRRPGPFFRIVKSSAGEQLVVFQTIGRSDNLRGLIQISTPTAPLKELLFRHLLAFMLLAMAALIFGLLAFLPVLKRTLVPLSNMVDTAARIDAGNLDQRFPVHQGQVEIDQLADSFNGMLQRLETSFLAEKDAQEQMRRFIADASHELRTPLTSINGFLEVLRRGAANNPEQLDKALTCMHSESQRLTKLVHDLLMLSRLDRSAHVELKTGWLDSVLSNMEPQLQILAGKRKLDIQISSDLKSRFDVDQIKQVILNIFQNAVQHTDQDSGEIAISLVNKDNGVRIECTDNGPGISEAHLPHVFDRFYRQDTSRTREHGGAGLGLAISQSIIEAHGGKMGVTSQEGHGSTFWFWIPAEG